MHGFLSENIKLIKVADHSTAAQTDVTSSSVDLAQDGGWDGVCFFTSYGTPAADNLMHLESSSDDASADPFADIAGSEVDLADAITEDQWVDCYRPPERYVRAIGQRGTSSTLESIWAILYRGKSLPHSLANLLAGTIYGKRVNSPAVGTK